MLSSRDVRLLASADGLANLKALELGTAEVEGLVLSGPLVSGPKGFGSGPSLERGPALPCGMGGIERVILGSGPLSRWNSTNPGTVCRWLSRDDHTFSKASSDPLATRNRFMAINIGGSPGHRRSRQSLNGSNTSEPAIST